MKSKVLFLIAIFFISACSQKQINSKIINISKQKNAEEQFKYAVSLGHGTNETSNEEFEIIVKAYQMVFTEHSASDTLIAKSHCANGHFYSVHICDWQKARENYQLVFTKFKHISDSYNNAKRNYALSYYNQRNYEKAKEEFSMILKENSNNFTLCTANMYLGKIYQEVELDFLNAEKYYLQALELYKKNPNFSGKNTIIALKKLYECSGKILGNFTQKELEQKLKNLNVEMIEKNTTSHEID